MTRQYLPSFRLGSRSSFVLVLNMFHMVHMLKMNKYILSDLLAKCLVTPLVDCGAKTLGYSVDVGVILVCECVCE